MEPRALTSVERPVQSAASQRRARNRTSGSARQRAAVGPSANSTATRIRQGQSGVINTLRGSTRAVHESVRHDHQNGRAQRPTTHPAIAPNTTPVMRIGA